MVICPERDADLHMAQLMPLPLTVSCFSKIQIGFTFLLLSAHAGSAGKEPLNGRVCTKFLRLQQVCVQLPAYADNVALPAFARRMLQQSVDI